MKFMGDEGRALVLALFAALLIMATLRVVPALADDNPATDSLAAACSVRPEFTPASFSQSGVQGVVPGEDVVFTLAIPYDEGTIFQDVLTRPDGSTYYASYLELTALSSALVVDTDSPELRIAPGGSADPYAAGVSQTLVAGPPINADDFVLDTSVSGVGDSVWRVIFPGDETQMLADQDGAGDPSYTVPEGGEIFVFSFRANVPSGAKWGEVLAGSECFASVSTGPSNRDTDRLRTAVATILPELHVEKNTPRSNAYVAGGRAPFELVATVPEVDLTTGTLTVAPARDVRLVDDVPNGLLPVDASGTPVVDGGLTGGGGLWNETGRTVTYEIGDMLPGATIVIDEEMQVARGVLPTTPLTNDVKGVLSYLPGNHPDDTILDPAATDDATITVASSDPAVTKEASVESYGLELPFEYTVTVDLPGDAEYHNLTVLDALPDGMQFRRYVSATCLPAGPTCPTPIETLAPTIFPTGGGTAIGWYPDALPADANPRQLIFTYEVQLDASYFNGDEVEFLDRFTNDVLLGWNTIDRVGAVTPSTASPPTFDGSLTTSDDVVYDRPILHVDKVVLTSDGVSADEDRASWDFEEGDTATYTTTVSNVGSREATDLRVVDVPTGLDIDPSSILVAGMPCAAPDCTWDGTSLAISFSGPMAPAGSVDISYTATPTRTGDLDNQINVSSYADGLGSTYTENPGDSVPLEIPDPVLVIEKDPADRVALTGVSNTRGTRFPFTFTVTNAGAVSAYNVVVTDDPPRNVCAVDNGLDPAAVGVTETDAGVFRLDDPLAPGASVTFEAEVEVCGSIDPGTYQNTANLTWEDLSDNTDASGTVYGNTDDAPLELVAPEFEVTKGPAVGSGETVNWSFDIDNSGAINDGEFNQGAWTITIENTSPAPIGGLVVTDEMPDSFEYDPGTASALWFGQDPDTFTDNSTASGTTVRADHTESLEFVIGQLVPGAEVRISVPFSHNGLVPADGNLARVNTVRVTNPNLTFDADRHEAQGEYTLIPIEDGPELVKTVGDPGVTPGGPSVEAAPGKFVDFTFEVTIPTSSTVTTHDVTIIDELPDGLALSSPPATGLVPGANGWTVGCVSGPCASASDGGVYLGSQLNPLTGTTDLAWFVGDVPPNAAETPIVMQVTFRAVVEATFDDGAEVIDGVREPLVNVAYPIFNRDDAVPGGSGDLVAGLPSAFPDPTDFDRAYPKDPAQVDIVTPRLDVAKTAFNANGDQVTELDAGQSFSYEIVYTNAGSGPAFDIDVTDDLANPDGLPFAEIDHASLAVTVGGLVATAAADGDGVTCSFDAFGAGAHLNCEIDGPLAGDPDGPSGPLRGDQIVVTYDATTVGHDDFFAQFSAQNHDPMFIRNTAQAVEYFEAAGEAGNRYSTGLASTRLFAYTPLPEIDMMCLGGGEVIPSAAAGTDVSFQVWIGNGDRVDVNGNPDGDRTLAPHPRVDNDGDGYPDAGFGYNPVVSITIQDNFSFNGVRGTGPGWGDPTHTTYTPFADPDVVLDEVRPGTYTLVWNSLPGIPHSPNHDEESDFLAWYDLLIDVTKLSGSSATFWYELAFTDALGNPDRGTNVNERFEFSEIERHGCPGGPPPRVWKEPDVGDSVAILPGQTDNFTIRVQQPDEALMSGSFLDNLPHGLSYAGDLPTTDPRYEEASISAVPANWTDDNDNDGDVDLQDYFTSSAPGTNGETVLRWDPPPLPQGMVNDPSAGGADTRWVLTIPVVADDVPPFPFEFVVNSFTWNTDEFGPRSDTGALLTEGGGRPSIEKRVVDRDGPYGSTFTYTIDITFPSGYVGTDVIVYDELNRAGNWDTPPYTDQALGNLSRNDSIFPVDPPVSSGPSAPGELSWASSTFTPAEFQLGTYVSDSCVSGCSGAADTINAVPMTPLPVVKTASLPINFTDPYHADNNGAIGWYLGDIAADPEGQDRVVRLTYTATAPTLEEQRQRVVDLHPTGFPGGIDDARFNDRDGYWMPRLSQVNHANLVQLRSFAGGNPDLIVWEGATDTDWSTLNNTDWSDLSGSRLLDQDDTAVTVAYPLVTMDKNCGDIDDPQGTNPGPSPEGSANVACELTISNSSPVDAYEVTVTDTPMDDCVIGARSYFGRFRYATSHDATNHNDPVVDGDAAGSGRVDPDDPAVIRYPCDISSQFINDPELQTDENSFPATWRTSLAPNQTKTFSYQLRIDGWTNQPDHEGNNSNDDWEISGAWSNDAVLQPWSAAEGGLPLGTELRVTDEVFFHDPYIQVTTFPFPEGRDLSEDARPFIDWFADPGECSVTGAWPYRYKHECGPEHDPADPRYSAIEDFGDPYGGDHWMNDQPAAYDDLLQPPSRAIDRFSWPMHLRGVPLSHHWTVWNGWRDFGDPYDVATGERGWWQQPLDDPDRWADAFLVEPSQRHTWSIDLRIDGMERLETLDITAQLPFGWDYEPGSARIVDGTWFLGHDDGWAEDNGVVPGYGLVPIADPIVDGSTERACDLSTLHGDGPTLRWAFDRDTPGEDQPWEFRYVDARERYADGTFDVAAQDYDKGESDKGNWIRVHYDAIPAPEILECDPDTQSSATWFMENNVSVSAVRDTDATVLTDGFDMIAPVPNPLTLEKLPDDDYITDETTSAFTITFTNDLDVPIQDITFSDELTSSPVGPRPDSGYDCGTATADGGVGFSEASCVGGLGSQRTTVEWNLVSIAPGETVIITMPIVVPKDETNLLRWDNTVETTVKEHHDVTLSDEGRITVVSAGAPPIPSKDAAPNPATINDVIEYEVSFTAAQFQAFFDLAYADLVPDGLTFVSFEGVSCEGACPNGFAAADVVELTPVVEVDGTTRLWWWFGDMPGSGGGDHTWTMRYRARVDDTYANTNQVLDEQVLTNTVQGFSNEENLLDAPLGIANTADWTTFPPSEEDTHDLIIAEPTLTIASSAVGSSIPLDSSGTVTFEIQVTNTADVPAYAVVVSDTPNGALENIVMNPPAFPGSVITAGWAATDPSVGWFIPVIQPGETATFTYVAEVADGFLERGFAVAANDAEIETFRARPGVVPEPGDRIYRGDQAMAVLPLAGPQLQIDKFVGGCIDDFAFATTGESTIWCLRIENAGDAPAYGAQVSDFLPHLWTYDPSSTEGSGWTVDEPTLSTPFAGVQQAEWAVGDLDPGAVVEIIFTATPQPGSSLNVANWAVVNSFQAGGQPLPPTVSGASDDDLASAALGRHALEIANVPDRQQWPYATTGGDVTWTLHIENPSPDTANTNLVVTDHLPVPFTYAGWASSDDRVTLVSASNASGPNGEDVVVWNISDLGAGESIDIELTASVAANATTENRWYLNDVEVVSDQVVDAVVNQANARFFNPASLGDRTWIDADADGIQNSNESSLDGVVVRLLDGAGTQLYLDSATGMIATSPAPGFVAMTTTTGDDPSTAEVEEGWYLLENLPTGAYQLEFVPPVGFGPTLENAGGDDAADSDVDPLTGRSHVVSLSPGQNDLTIDAGFVPIDQFLADLAAIDIEKDTNGVQADTAPGPVIEVGGDVTWTYVVTNTGVTALIDSTVVDSQGVSVECDVERDGAFDDGNVIPLLLPGASLDCRGTGTATAGQYANQGSVEGDPVVPDTAVCGCNLADPSTWPADATQYVVATGPGGADLGSVTDDDLSHYFGFVGEIDIEKATNDVDADLAPGPVIPVGRPVVWTYEVTNTSTVALVDATVIDSEGVVVVCDSDGDGVFGNESAGASSLIPLLLPGESVTCQGEGVAIAGPYANLGEVTSTPVLPDPATCGCDMSTPTTWPDDPDRYVPPVDEFGGDLPRLEDDDPSHYFGEEPGLGIEKSTNGVDADTGPGPGIAAGGPVSWVYEISNSSLVAIAPATVTDSEGVVVSCDIDGDGTPDDTNAIPLLLPGAVVICEGTGVAEIGPYRNIGVVEGPPQVPNPATCGCDLDDVSTWPNDPTQFEPLLDPTTGRPADDYIREDPSHYFGVDAEIDIEKATNGEDADVAPGVEVIAGDVVTWTYVVTNESSTPLLDASVTDDQGVEVQCDVDSDGLFDDGHVIPLLLPSQVATCQGQGVAIAGPYQNMGAVTSTPGGPDPETCGCDPTDDDSWPTIPDAYVPLEDAETGTFIDTVDDEDPSNYHGDTVDLSLEKSLESVTPKRATFGFLVASHGPGTVPGPIEIADNLPDGLSYLSSSGQGWTCSAAGQRVTCLHPSDLPAGVSAPPLEVITSISAPPNTELVNDARTRSVDLGTIDLETNITNNDDSVRFVVPYIPTTLPFTGAATSSTTQLAALLLALGGGLVFLSRRRRRAHETNPARS